MITISSLLLFIYLNKQVYSLLHNFLLTNWMKMDDNDDFHIKVEIYVKMQKIK